MDDYVVNFILKFLQVNIKKATEFGGFFREIIMKKKSLGFLLNKGCSMKIEIRLGRATQA